MALQAYFVPLLRRWWLILLTVAAATISGVLAVLQLPPIYQSRAILMVGRSIANPNPSSADLYLPQQLASTYADTARSELVRKATMATLQVSWLPDYMVRVVPNTQMMEITVNDSHPEFAQAVANETARQLILLSPSGSDLAVKQRQDFINGQLNDLEASIVETRAAIDKKQGELGNLFSARQIADAQSQISALQTKLSTLQANYASLLVNTRQGAANSIEVIEPASLPSTPIGPNKRAMVLMAAAVGLALGVMACYVIDYLDDTLNSPEDLQANLGLDTLASVPYSRSPEGNGPRVAEDSWHATEAYSILRTNLEYTTLDHPLSLLLVTSPGPAEGKSTVSANLARAMARADRRVILVDMDLRQPTLHRVFCLPNNAGVTTAMLNGGADPGELLHETETPGLRVLTSGPLPPNPATLLGSKRARQLLASLQEQADVVVLDSPPVAVIADATILAGQADGVLLVIRAGWSRRGISRQALAGLTRVNARVLGAVLNRVSAHGRNYYYYERRHGGRQPVLSAYHIALQAVTRAKRLLGRGESSKQLGHDCPKVGTG